MNVQEALREAVSRIRPPGHTWESCPVYMSGHHSFACLNLCKVSLETGYVVSAGGCS